VYVRELSRELGRRGYLIDIFTRRYDESTLTVLSLSRTCVSSTCVRSRKMKAQAPSSVTFTTSNVNSLLRLRKNRVRPPSPTTGFPDALACRCGRVGRSPCRNVAHLAQEKNRLPVGEKESVRRLLAERRISQEADVAVARESMKSVQ
jgi:hypothetical protein